MRGEGGQKRLTNHTVLQYSIFLERKRGLYLEDLVERALFVEDLELMSEVSVPGGPS